MMVRLDDCPMVVSNRIKFIFSKYDEVSLHFNRDGLNICYTDWTGKKHRKLIGTYE